MAFDFHPDSQAVIEYLKQHQYDRSNLSIADIRKLAYERNKVFSGGSDGPFSGKRVEHIVPSKYNKEGIPVFVYTPNNMNKDPVIFVYLHGGGMVIGTRHTSDSLCKHISELAGCIMVNVEYRLAPEYKFPAQMEDAETVVNWVKQNKPLLGGSDLSKVGLGGDSAGGTITGSIAHDVPLDFQVLVYPHPTKRYDYSLPSFNKYVNGPLLTVPSIQWFESQYVPESEASNPRLVSILRPSFSHLPPTIFIIAEHDPLYDGGMMYANKLKEAGVSVEVHEFKGAIHAFFGATAICPTLNKEAYEKVSDFIKNIHKA